MPIFIGCMPRSGSSLLRIILDSHPKIEAGPEFKWMEHREPISALTCNVNKCNKIYVNKTPKNLSKKALKLLNNNFNNFKFVVITRDARNIACSYLKSINPREFAKSEFLNDARIAIKGHKYLKSSDIDYYKINYEDLVNNTKESILELCDYLGVKWHKDMMNHHKKNHKIVDHHSDKNAIKPIFKSSLDQYDKYKELFDSKIELTCDKLDEEFGD